MQMPNLILFDDSTRQHLLPLVFTKPIAELRIGITTIRQKWEHYFGTNSSTLTSDYLEPVFPIHLAQNNLLINASVLPNDKLVQQIIELPGNHAIVDGEVLIALHVTEKYLPMLHTARGELRPMLADYRQVSLSCSYTKLHKVSDLFTLNDLVLRSDFATLTHNRQGVKPSSTNTCINESAIFIEEGAKVEGAILNASTGPIYIGRDAEIMEGAMVRGPLAMCANSVLKMGTKVYGASTLGPYVKVGGELNNVVVMGYSNKAHDGFLGNAVIGEWCNLGADTNNSNLKNNYGDVRIFNYGSQQMESTGLQFCGLIMGDHAKTGINTMLNTGTIIGVAANVFGAGFPPKHIASFSWGGADTGFTTHQLDKAIATAEKMYARRNKKMSEAEKQVLKYVYTNTQKFR